ARSCATSSPPTRRPPCWTRRRSTPRSTWGAPSPTPTSRSAAGRPSLADAVHHLASGKVRELYAAGDDHLVLVASDRISAFDVVLPTPIPDKGRVLTGLSKFWFGRTEEIVPNHLITTDLGAYPAEAQGAPDLAGRSMLVNRLTMMPIECVVRGYLVGSGWKDYQRTGTVCGHSLPEGMVEAQKLPKPIFTPSTKATDGHDQNIDRDAGIVLVGEERFDR